MHNQFIRCPENMQDLSGQKQYNYAVMLAGSGIYSRKTIRYIKKTGKYSITNHIDETRQSLTEKELMKSLIGKAMPARCLIALID